MALKDLGTECVCPDTKRSAWSDLLVETTSTCTAASQPHLHPLSAVHLETCLTVHVRSARVEGRLGTLGPLSSASSGSGKQGEPSFQHEWPIIIIKASIKSVKNSIQYFVEKGIWFILKVWRRKGYNFLV